MPLDVGSIVEGKVTGITAFGAFIQLPESKTGLVHISEVAQEYVKDVSAHLKESQMVKVKIISIDANGKISLSIKKAMEPKPVEHKPMENIARSPAQFEWSNNKGAVNNSNSFEDRLAKFLKDSDEKLLDLKKNVDSKRRNSGYRKSAQ